MTSRRFVDALAYAAELHADQRRKGTEIPYVSHLLAVAALVLEHGGTETQAIAALLHDAIEDQPRGGQTRVEIEERFGADVLAIVEACTDNAGEPEPPWRERKERYLAHIPAMPAAARLVSMADKVHNARAIRSDLRTVGAAVWARFNSPQPAVLWYYRSLAEAFAAIDAGPLARELWRAVAEIEAEK
jgi:(p)ppGpp synthase/HD superfamily hydrolase